MKKSKRAKKSNSWKIKQNRDQFYKKSKTLGYRSRASFKLIELNAKFKFIKRNTNLLDLGSSPGGWSQVASKIITNGKILSIDTKPMMPIKNVNFFNCDIFNHKSKDKIIEYFNGRRSVFHLPLKLELAPFYKKTLMEVRKVKYGQKVSYGMVAKIIGSKNAVRAVGTANSKNPLPIIIPCHRVVCSNGQLGGYNGGVEKKSILLNLESTYLNTVF